MESFVQRLLRFQYHETANADDGDFKRPALLANVYPGYADRPLSFFQYKHKSKSVGIAGSAHQQEPFVLQSMIIGDVIIFHDVESFFF